MRSLTRSESIGVIALLMIITVLVGWNSLRMPGMHVSPGIVIRPTAQISSVPAKPISTIQSSSPDSAASEIVVHVAGAVHKPGVYHLKPGSRNDDAITAAGGSLSTANTDAINLAAHIEDGSQLYIPTRTELPEGGAPALSSPASKGSQPHNILSRTAGYGQNGTNKPAKLTSASQGQVNLNTASAEELQKLPGIGPSMAERIITYRKENGGFKSAEDLREVSGIGDKRYDKIRPLVRIK